jgi:hypothetical protein
MSLLAAFVFSLALAGDDEDALGPKTVNVQTAALFQKVKPVRGGYIRDARYKEELTVTAVEGSYAKVTLADGASAYIARSALVARDKFVPAPANEEEMGRMKAQGYEAGRFDPETEAKYKKDKGPALDAAYKQVDALEARALVRQGRGALEQILADFRKDGKLGEFSSVR